MTTLVRAQVGDVEVPYSSLDAEVVIVSIVVPTRNEADNVASLTEALSAVMADTGLSWELLFVDDSDDASPGIVTELGVVHPEVSLIHRKPGDRRDGLSGAVVAGLRRARGRLVVVMDADFQHPPEMVPRLIFPLVNGDCDLAVASRYVAGASSAGMAGPMRRAASRTCAALAHAIVPATRAARDPMSGFFAFHSDALRDVDLRPKGFKILTEVLARGRVPRVLEIPFCMDVRAGSASKAGTKEGLRFLGHLGRLARPDLQRARSLATRLARLGPLAAILAVQGWLSVRLIYSNTAFMDEANYLSAGRFLLHTWMTGHGPNMRFETYYSGAPVIYPVIGSLIDSVAGLHGARFLSLAFMLLSTCLCYATATRLFGRTAGLVAAGLFATTEGTQYLGALATYDAMAVFLIAFAAWLVVRCASSASSSGLVYLAVPVLVLANATKYASTAFDFVVIGLAFFVVCDRHDPRGALRVAGTITAGLVAALSALAALAGPSYLTGIMSTTVARPASHATSWQVIHLAWSWVGAIACVAALALGVAAVVAWRRRGSWAAAGTLAVLGIGVMLAPINQARIHTATSLSKHVTFGAFFGAIAAGYLVGRAAEWRRRTPWRHWLALPAAAACVAAMVPLASAGAASARHQFEGWPNSTRITTALGPMLRGQHQFVLMDDVEVARYYLEGELSLPHWVGTFYYSYTKPHSTSRLVGIPAYIAGVDHGVFSVIALNFAEQLKVDHAIASAIHTSGRYRWVGNFTTRSIYGPNTYVVWRTKTVPS